MVIGASGGAGSAVTRELARKGKRVRAVNRSKTAVFPDGVEAFPADVQDPTAVREACRGAAVVSMAQTLMEAHQSGKVRVAFLQMVFEEAGQPPRIGVYRRPLLRIVGLFSPVVRELVEMLYQFEAPFVMDGRKFDDAFGPFVPTPHREAIRQTLAWHDSISQP